MFPPPVTSKTSQGKESHDPAAQKTSPGVKPCAANGASRNAQTTSNALA
jgi:hypothetical protein